MIHGQGEMTETNEGARRESNDGRGRFDLFPYEAMEALAKWYEDGAKKYGDRNWEKGLSVKDCINRMVRHALKAANGWTDEDHLSAVMWNAAAAITMMERRPDCNDHPWKDQETFSPEFMTKEFYIPALGPVGSGGSGHGDKSIMRDIDNKIKSAVRDLEGHNGYLERR